MIAQLMMTLGRMRNRGEPPADSVELVVTKKVVGDPDEPWRYWMTRPIEERIDTVEELRREFHGWVRGSEPGLPRVLGIVRPA